MLLTALEIVAFLVAASIIGVALGWVLRGTLGNEQAEISDLRAQLRQLKKANRESKMAVAEVSAAKATATAATEKSAKPKATPKAAASASTAKAKKPTVKKKATTKKPGVRKTQAEREADQAVGRKAFTDVVARVGKAEADDKLVKINGIGKKYAEMLNDLGISSYAQIAQLRKTEIRTLAVALGVLDDRLETEDWVGSAKKLMKGAKK